ncbi:hypothetical protein [Pontibacillus salipaludis]|uniref:hypothetical protein n=1 Tax=Pontibacillus salipaludis TaxID=1697394 RepID=UPI0031EA2137
MKQISLISLVLIDLFILTGCSNDYLNDSEIHVNVVGMMQHVTGEEDNIDVVIDEDNKKNEYREWLKVAKSEEGQNDLEIETGIPVLEIEFRNKQREIYISHANNGGYLRHGTVFYRLSEEHLDDLYNILSIKEAVIE